MNREEAVAFLESLGRELKTQDGMDTPQGPTHATAWPVYMVEEKKRVYGIDPNFVDPDGYDPDLDDAEPSTWPDERGYPYMEERRFVQGAVSLTRSGIEAYIAANNHNMREPRVYVASANRVQSMRLLITALHALAAPAAAPSEGGER